MEPVKFGHGREASSINYFLFDMFSFTIYVRFTMKKKATRIVKNKPAKSGGLASVETSQANPVSPEASEVPSTQPRGELISMPDPQSLLLEADQEPNYRDLAEYVEVIRTLRKKGFTYRDVAEWLSARGVEADHNAVYRVYTKNMSHADAADEARREEDEAREEATRSR